MVVIDMDIVAVTSVIIPVLIFFMTTLFLVNSLFGFQN